MTKNKKKLWFKAKMYGWGWQPTTWQGWILTLLYAFALVRAGLYFGIKNHSGSDFLINFSVYFVIITIPFLAICYLKGEKPRWRWGR